MKQLYISQIPKKKSKVISAMKKRKSNVNSHVVNQTESGKNAEQVVNNLRGLVTLFPNVPSLLTGPLRHLKVEPHYREPTCRLLRSPQAYRKTSKIRLTGNWIEKAGFNTHERIRVIPMHRMLIIIPETQIDKKIKGR